MNPLKPIFTWLCIVSTIGADFVSLCYFTNWAFERPESDARFSHKNIDPYLCSHLIYAFVDIDPTDLVLSSKSQHEESKYKEFNNLKTKNKDLRTLVSVGGQNAKSKQFAAVSSNIQNIHHFVKTSAKFLRDRGFDGLDLDWEYPTRNTKEQFTILVKELRKEFDEEAIDSGKERLIITIAVPAGRARILDGYQPEELAKYVDYFNVMAYDYFGPWNRISGFNSPLYPRDSDTRFSPELNMQWTVEQWIRLKVPKEKIVVGMTGAGASFILNDTDSHGVGAKVDGGAEPGRLYKFEGRLVYPEICELEQNGGTVVFDTEQKVPYLYKDDLWVGYDNPKSIKAKVKWMIIEGYGGAMFWSLDFDDFSGKFCKKDKFPLLKAMQLEISKYTKKPVYTEHPKEVFGRDVENYGFRSVQSCVTLVVFALCVACIPFKFV
ncbi:hypothetical protein LOTGIDRAFT_227027 [Lottia gigantea]|uniref:GH18 domain-containing protein n=1 Tax=Lottia gigantea TaxID=225164 RepID=V4ANQ5_LOTGI|nr:hypothetical protein LOTGIDRAFT_227027 [Lottia gigantea]ESO96380.1 hypothetical protein LOTGIDRAFT_227027 [Lottia gigantea]